MTTRAAILRRNFRYPTTDYVWWYVGVPSAHECSPPPETKYADVGATMIRTPGAASSRGRPIQIRLSRPSFAGCDDSPPPGLEYAMEKVTDGGAPAATDDERRQTAGDGPPPQMPANE